MGFDDLVCEYRGTITSLKVLPFDDGSAEVKYELSQVLTHSGRLSGAGFGSSYVRAAADGTSVTKFYGLVTTTEGEAMRLEFGEIVRGWSTVRMRSAGAVRGDHGAPSCLTCAPLRLPWTQGVGWRIGRSI